MSEAALRRAPTPLFVDLKGTLLVAAAALCFSTGGLIVRSLETTDAWTIVFWRSLSATVFLLAFILLRDGRRAAASFRAVGWPGVLVGACFAAASICFVVALNLTTVAQTIVFVSAVPLISAVLGWVFIGERVGAGTWATIGIVMAGIVFMVSADLSASGSVLGSVFAAGVALSYAGSIVVTRKHPEIRMAPAACLGAAMAMVVALPFASPMAVTAHDLPLLVTFGFVQLGLALALFVTGAQLIPAAHTALIALLEPILAPVWAWLFAGETPPATTIVGGAVVLVAIIVNTAMDLRRAARGEAEA